VGGFAGAKELRGQLVLGTATLGLHAAMRSRDGDIATIRAAYEAGIRAFDTARVYSPVGDPLYAESLLADALYGLDDLVVMTKGGHFRTPDGGFGVDNSSARLRQDVEDSLRALRTDRIDLYLLHRADDESVPIADSVAESRSLPPPASGQRLWAAAHAPPRWWVAAQHVTWNSPITLPFASFQVAITSGVGRSTTSQCLRARYSAASGESSTLPYCPAPMISVSAPSPWR